MRNFILTLLLVVVGTITISAKNLTTNVEPKHYYSVELTDSINTVHVAIPCRIIYGKDESLDTSLIVINDRTATYNIYCVQKDNIIYIKSNLRHEELVSLENLTKTTPPIIRIMTNTSKTPELVTGSGFNIIQTRSYEKATVLSNK